MGFSPGGKLCDDNVDLMSNELKSVCIVMYKHSLAGLLCINSIPFPTIVSFTKPAWGTQEDTHGKDHDLCACESSHRITTEL